MTSVPRETLLNLKGLITTPNEYGVYPEGALSQASNILCRSANQWIPSYDVDLVRADGFTADITHRLVKMAPGRFLSIVVDYTTYTTWAMYMDALQALALTLPTALSATDLFDPDGYLNPITARSRLFLNSRQGVLVLDTLDPQTSGERALRNVGLPQLRLSFGNVLSGGAIPADTVVGYQAVIRRRYADGYVLISPPSPALRVEDSFDYDVNLTYLWDYTEDVQEGDELELYRTAGINGAGAVDPGTSMRLVDVVRATAAHVAAKSVTFEDRKVMTAPLYETAGEEIYTSPYSGGAASANLPPPVCKTMAQWGDYTFYGNLTRDPVWTLDVPAGIMDTQAAGSDFVRTNGIGRRVFTGTVTSGSPTITGISASEILGIVPGQFAYDLSLGAFSTAAKVVSVGASSITLDENAAASGSGLCNAYDVLEINGLQFAVDGFLTTFLTRPYNPPLAVFPSDTVRLTGTGGYFQGVTIAFSPMHPGSLSAITVRGTNGQNYSPPLPEIDEAPTSNDATARPNVFRWSKQNQPEAVPSSNEGYAGAGEIIRMLPTTDQLWFLCTDGLRRLTGAAGQWQLDLVDPGFVPVAPDASAVLFDTLYSYTERGVAAIRGTEALPLSRGVIDAEFPVRPFTATRKVQLVANETDEEIIIIRQGVAYSDPGTMHVYATLYRQWSDLSFFYNAVTCGASFDPNTGAAAYMLFGAYYGNTNKPAVFKWPGFYLLQPTIRLQPMYAEDPALLKHWIDVTWLIANPSGFTLTMYPTFSGVSVGTVFPGAFGARERRPTIGVPRRFAISETLEPGCLLYIASGTPYVVKGLSARLVPLTNQSRGRK